jgi:hypothetical protein
MGGLSKVAYTVRVSAYVGSILVSEPETSQQETERGSTSVITELGTTVRDEPRPACTFEPSTYSKWGGERESFGKGGRKRSAERRHIFVHRVLSVQQGPRQACDDSRLRWPGAG